MDACAVLCDAGLEQCVCCVCLQSDLFADMHMFGVAIPRSVVCNALSCCNEK